MGCHKKGAIGAEIVGIARMVAIRGQESKNVFLEFLRKLIPK